LNRVLDWTLGKQGLCLYHKVKNGIKAMKEYVAEWKNYFVEKRRVHHGEG
jgi:hypothetical protein